jgi:hypothetical protein
LRGEAKRAEKSERLALFAEASWRNVSAGVLEVRPPAAFTLASPRCLDGGDVDLLHRHHRLESTLCLLATSRNCIG